MGIKMSVGFNWFKSYKIHIHKGTTMFDYDDSDIEYIGGGSTSYSGYNIGLVQDLIENIVEREYLLYKENGSNQKIRTYI